MRLLVLGGTLFLGRHVVEAALDRGHQVTIFTRGRTNPGAFPEVEQLLGDRDGDLGTLEGREWDAVIDPSGYVPRVVRMSAELLAEAVGHYTLVSSISAYRDFDERGFDETYPTGKLPDDHGEDVDGFYGQLKAASEVVVREVYEDRCAVVRSGLIVGRYDWTNRFGWWVRRVAEGGDVLVPDAERWPVQIVHGRDLTDWMLGLAERGVAGTPQRDRARDAACDGAGARDGARRLRERRALRPRRRRLPARARPRAVRRRAALARPRRQPRLRGILRGRRE
jgi:nucleoside-diphosphate-sugar epimerase